MDSPITDLQSNTFTKENIHIEKIMEAIMENLELGYVNRARRLMF